jgi:oligoendopeptidase F
MSERHELEPLKLPDAPGEWSLELLYSGTADPMLARDLEAADRYAHRARTRAVIGDLAGAIAALEQALTLSSRISAYAELLRATPQIAENAERAFYLERRIDAIEGVGLAVEETIALSEDAAICGDMLRPRRAFLERVRRAMPRPATDLEGGFARRARRRRVRSAFLDALSMATINRPGRPQSVETARAGLVTQKVAEAGLKVKQINTALEAAAPQLAKAYLDVLEVEISEARAAGFAHVIEHRLAAMGLASQALSAMTHGTLAAALPRVQRWYRAKAEHLGVDALPHWARFHPDAGNIGATVDWPLALDATLSALAQLGNPALKQGEALIREARLDACARGADAFCHPADGRPFVRAPFRGGLRDALALAHECGHAAHQGIAFAAHGVLCADTPGPIAETTAGLTEILAFEILVKNSDAEAEQALRRIAGEDALHRTIVQITVHRFELAVLTALENGERPDADWIGGQWLSLHRDTFSPVLAFGDGFAHWWALESLIARRPLYSFSYPFAAGMTSAMLEFRRHRGPRRFERAVIDFMRAGGAATADELTGTFFHGALFDDSENRTPWQAAIEDHLQRYMGG